HNCDLYSMYSIHFFFSSFSSSLFRWSNVIYFTNRYPVVAYQIWSVCYTPNIPQATDTEADSCDALYQFFWFFSFIPTRIAITVSWILRVYAVVDHGLVFAIMLSLLGLAIVGFDIVRTRTPPCPSPIIKPSRFKIFCFTM
ncbi:hypothetical protein F5879DRAFT_961881, partial [Lentinula edodes]